MWERYARTFITTQGVIGLVTLAALRTTHLVFVAVAFFAAMQAGAIVGAMWGARLRRRLGRSL